MSEIVWKPIPGYDGYEISNKGDVKSFKRNGEKILKQVKDADGYLLVDIMKDNKRRLPRVHRLVLQSFHPIEDDAKMLVDHIDRDRANNCIGMVANKKQFIAGGFKWAWKDEEYEERTQIKKPVALYYKGIQQLDMNTGEVINTFDSVTEAFRSIGAPSVGGISAVANGTRKSAFGFKWQWVQLNKRYRFLYNSFILYRKRFCENTMSLRVKRSAY